MSNEIVVQEIEGSSDDEESNVIAFQAPKLEEAEMDITPMIDCTFLLLIFFLVCSHIDQAAPLILPKAKNAVAVPAKLSVVISVTQSEGGPAMIYKGDGANAANLIPSGDVQAQEDEITRYVESGLHAPGLEAKQSVLIKAEPNVKHREISRIARAAARASDTKLKQIHVAVMEGQ